MLSKLFKSCFEKLLTCAFLVPRVRVILHLLREDGVHEEPRILQRKTSSKPFAQRFPFKRMAFSSQKEV